VRAADAQRTGKALVPGFGARARFPASTSTSMVPCANAARRQQR